MASSEALKFARVPVSPPGKVNSGTASATVDGPAVGYHVVQVVECLPC
jgi:hypothetical protein